MFAGTRLPFIARRGYHDGWAPLVTVNNSELDGTDELYDLLSDPLEMTNLVADPAHRATLTTMQRGLRAWQQETGDTWPDVVRPSSRDQALRLAGGSPR